MWFTGWRDEIWHELSRPWDLIVIGGGITGAGILREAVRAGFRTLLVEGHDFSSGTSSRSSKLVHGGFRYLKNAQIKLTYQAVRERERLLREARGLVTPLGFLMANFTTDHLPAWLFGLGLTFYDILALRWRHKHYDPTGIRQLCPQLSGKELTGGYRFIDAQADDARLVLRLIREAVRQGGTAINYACVEGLSRNRSGEISGIWLRDVAPQSKGRSVEVNTKLVINATGAWADNLRSIALSRSNFPSADNPLQPHLRKLRGSHLIFPCQRLPLSRAISFCHPVDNRPVFAFPWEGVAIIGTTDVDHGREGEIDPCIDQFEVEYLLHAARFAFPSLELSPEDVQSTFSGIRAVVDTGKADPSRESREHVLWYENGLLTVTGGKLTTFRLMANDALQFLCHFLPDHPSKNHPVRIFDPTHSVTLNDYPIDNALRLRLQGRYGPDLPGLLSSAQEGELEPISTSPAIWAELRWAARAEAVLHLEDLMLRRIRLGLLLPGGGIPFLNRIRSIVQDELGWDDALWMQEAENYQRLWERCYSLSREQT